MSVGESDQLREYVDALQEQVTHLKIAADQAREETSAQLRTRIEQAKADAAAHQEPAREQAGQAAGRTQSQWQSMKADAAAKMRDMHDRIGRKRDELDVKMASSSPGPPRKTPSMRWTTPGGRPSRLNWLSLMRSMPAPGRTNGRQHPGRADLATL